MTANCSRGSAAISQDETVVLPIAGSNDRLGMVRGSAPKSVGATGAEADETEPTGGSCGHAVAGSWGATNAEGGSTGTEVGTCAIPGGGGTSYCAPEGGGAYGAAGGAGASGRWVVDASRDRAAPCTSGRCGMNGGSNT